MWKKSSSMGKKDFFGWKLGDLRQKSEVSMLFWPVCPPAPFLACGSGGDRLPVGFFAHMPAPFLAYEARAKIKVKTQ